MATFGQAELGVVSKPLPEQTSPCVPMQFATPYGNRSCSTVDSNVVVACVCAWALSRDSVWCDGQGRVPPCQAAVRGTKVMHTQCLELGRRKPRRAPHIKSAADRQTPHPRNLPQESPFCPSRALCGVRSTHLFPAMPHTQFCVISR